MECISPYNPPRTRKRRSRKGKTINERNDQIHHIHAQCAPSHTTRRCTTFVAKKAGYSSNRPNRQLGERTTTNPSRKSPESFQARREAEAVECGLSGVISVIQVQLVKHLQPGQLLVAKKKTAHAEIETRDRPPAVGQRGQSGRDEERRKTEGKGESKTGEADRRGLCMGQYRIHSWSSAACHINLPRVA